MSGIASGVGIGVIRGMSTGSFYASQHHDKSLTPHILGRMIAGHWAIATFSIVSLGTWYVIFSRYYTILNTGCRHLCQKQIADERKKVAKIIESMPQRSVKQATEETKSSVTKSPA